MGLFGSSKKGKLKRQWFQDPTQYYNRVFAPLETAEREASVRGIEQSGYETDAARQAAIANLQQNLESRGVAAGGMQGGVAERMGLQGQRMKNLYSQGERDRIARLIGAMRAQAGSTAAELEWQRKMANASRKKRGGIGALLGGAAGFLLGGPVGAGLGMSAGNTMETGFTGAGLGSSIGSAF